MQTLTPLPRYQPDMDTSMAMPSDIPHLFGSLSEWGSSSHIFEKRSSANFLEVSIPELRNPSRGYPSRHDIDDLKHNHTPMNSSMPTYDGYPHGGQLDQPPETQHFHAPAMYAPHPTFTALNTSQNEIQNLKTETISPLQTSFEPSFNPGLGFHTDTGVHSATSSTFDSVSRPSPETPPIKRRRRSAWSSGGGEASSPPSISKSTGRRRKSEHVEPGSARAIYLEKNRKAASKCRTKQRMQQQELVETAREMERKNKQLKTEVEFLKSDMRDLMTIVGQHSDCPDGRLKLYVQREADRLISRDAVGKDPMASSQQQKPLEGTETLSSM